MNPIQEKLKKMKKIMYYIPIQKKCVDKLHYQKLI